MGYRLILYPISALLAAARTRATRLRRASVAARREARRTRDVRAYNEIVGLAGYLAADAALKPK